jgi:hypothetical protein
MAQQTNLQIPSAEVIEFRIEDQLEYGKFYFSGLRKGQGITVANALRRVLLYDIQGIGITSLQFSKNSKESGSILYNEFSSIPRFRESVLEIGINISSIVCGFSSLPLVPESFAPHTYGAVLEKRRFSLHKMFHNFGPNPDSASFKVEGSQVFILQAKHIFDPKFWVDKTSEGDFGVRSNSGGDSRAFEKNLDTKATPKTIILKNPDHIVGSFFISYDSKKGLEYPDLDIEYTIGTLSDIKFRNEHLGENPGGINIGGAVSTLASDLNSNVNKGSHPYFQISHETESLQLSKDSRGPLSERHLPLNPNSFTCANETNFFPVKRVNYSVQEKNFGEEVFLEIWTNRSLTPQEAFSEALDSLIGLFGNLSL